MRSEKIIPLFKKISSLKGIGPKLENAFVNLFGDSKIVYFFWNIPKDFSKRNLIKKITLDDLGKNVILKIKINKHNIFFKNKIFRINCDSNNVDIDIVFFRGSSSYIKNSLPLNEEKIISGKLELYKNKFQITHPENILNINEINEIKIFQPLYSLTKGITQKVYYKTLTKSLINLPNLDEWINIKTIKKYNFLPWKDTLNKIHNPTNESDLINKNQFRRRLAYDELMAHQLSLSIIKQYNKKNKGIKFSNNHKINIFIKSLPYELTQSQKTSINEIKNDLLSEYQMIRLLQGDVGSGKTIISIIAMLIGCESGFQNAIMAPTEILATQHYETISKFLKSTKFKIILLTGKDIGKDRQIKLEQIKNQSADIIIGTHSLIQEDVHFKKLGLVIIDEQHRFGVHQRLAFTYKGLKPNILVMTATPIPRTLTLAVYGDMSESRIIEKPIGRVEINTTAKPINKIKDLIDGIKRIIKLNQKIYWVCPMIDESEEIDLEAANVRYEKLKKIFGQNVLLIHGQMKSLEKEIIMKKFKNENYNILVATTVIEVGIDIPDASSIIIEHAERFGLAQLHQLRGRVGRGNIKSNCVLLYKENLGSIAKERINIMRKTNDGFKIAEKDLEIRGPGEILGKKQSGFPNFFIADLTFDKDLFDSARLEIDNLFISSKEININENHKNLLYLFEKDIALKTLKSG
ncbi:MAG: ATP-dependent DNA helicase RecG [Pelagibacteraceae bacterium]|nr:ATP-dependent DNA helicase RecG [Pelagibacteraceae bacterium]